MKPDRQRAMRPLPATRRRRLRARGPRLLRCPTPPAAACDHGCCDHRHWRCPFTERRQTFSVGVPQSVKSATIEANNAMDRDFMDIGPSEPPQYMPRSPGNVGSPRSTAAGAFGPGRT